MYSYIKKIWYHQKHSFTLTEKWKQNIWGSRVKQCFKEQKRIKTATYEEVDSPMYKWLKNLRHSNIPVNSDIFKMEVPDFAKSLGFDNFQASNGWLRTWKKSFNASFKTVSGKYTFTTSLEVFASNFYKPFLR